MTAPKCQTPTQALPKAGAGPSPCTLGCSYPDVLVGELLHLLLVQAGEEELVLELLRVLQGQQSGVRARLDDALPDAQVHGDGLGHPWGGARGHSSCGDTKRGAAQALACSIHAGSTRIGLGCLPMHCHWAGFATHHLQAARASWAINPATDRPLESLQGAAGISPDTTAEKCFACGIAQPKRSHGRCSTGGSWKQAGIQHSRTLQGRCSWMQEQGHCSSRAGCVPAAI